MTDEMDLVHQQAVSIAFDKALDAGVLSHNDSVSNYVGHYMYMGMELVRGKIRMGFKNIDTREYLWLIITGESS